MASIQRVFSADPEFCSSCGSILPVAAGSAGDTECTLCHTVVRDYEETEDLEEITYVIHFNDPDVYTKEMGITKKKKGKKKKQEQVEGPTVTRECRECGHNVMSYATLQLRSADEGQTVFYTCTKCKFKESENS